MRKSPTFYKKNNKKKQIKMLWCYCIKGLMKISYYLHVDCLASGGNLSQTRKWLVSFLGSSPGYHQTKKVCRMDNQQVSVE